MVNLGIGMPEGVAAVAAEERIIDLITLTAEPGVIGGVPAGGLNFGAAVNTQAVIDQPYQFDFYDGGGLDVAVLGMAEVDAEGNVNVSKFGPKLGRRGLHQHQPERQGRGFVGTFMAGDLRVKVGDGSLNIVQDGSTGKFVAGVEHPPSAAPRRCVVTPVLYVERAVFPADRCRWRQSRDLNWSNWHRASNSNATFSPGWRSSRRHAANVATMEAALFNGHRSVCASAFSPHHWPTASTSTRTTRSISTSADFRSTHRRRSMPLSVVLNKGSAVSKRASPPWSTTITSASHRAGRPLCRDGEPPHRPLLQPRHPLRHGWLSEARLATPAPAHHRKFPFQTLNLHQP